MDTTNHTPSHAHGQANALVPLKPFEVFRDGTFVGSDGKTEFTFSAEQVKEIQAEYDPTVFKAPIVVGHPKIDSPAFGWVNDLSLNNNLLIASDSEVTPEFADAAVKGKRYNKVSIALFEPNNPANPKPGKWYLRHIGFLGGNAPAVPGLKPVEFAGQEAACEFASSLEWHAPSMFRALRDWMISKFGLEDADSVLPSWRIDSAAEDVVRRQAREELHDNPSFSTPPHSEGAASTQGESMDAQTQAQLAAKDAEINQLKADIAAREAVAKKQSAQAEFAAILAPLALGLKINPRDKGAWLEIFGALSEAEQLGAKPQFAAASAHEGKSATEVLKALLEAQSPVVALGQVTPVGGQSTSTPQFSAPEGAVVDSEGLALHQKALAYQAAHQGVEYMDAVRAVSA